MKLRPAIRRQSKLVSLFLLFISCVHPSQALADSCRKVLQQEGIRYKWTYEPVKDVYMSWGNEDFIKCGGDFSSISFGHTWNCGDKKFSGRFTNYTQFYNPFAVDRSGNYWSLIPPTGASKLLPEVTSSNCARISQYRFLDKTEYSYSGILANNNTSVRFKLIQRTSYSIISPDF